MPSVANKPIMLIVFMLNVVAPFFGGGGGGRREKLKIFAKI